MPFAREEEEHAASADGDPAAEAGAGEQALAAGDVEQLVFAQGAAALLGEEVAGGMVARRIGHAGSDVLVADRIDGEAPFQVQGADDQILQVQGIIHISVRFSDLARRVAEMSFEFAGERVG